MCYFMSPIEVLTLTALGNPDEEATSFLGLDGSDAFLEPLIAGEETNPSLAYQTQEIISLINQEI